MTASCDAKARPRDAAASALAIGEQVEAVREELEEELRTVAPAVEHDGDPAWPDEGADLGEHARQHLSHPRVRLGRDDEERIPCDIVDPVVGGGGHGQAHPGDVRLRQRALAVVDPHVPIDVEEPHRGPAVRHPSLGQGAAERRGPPEGGQARELAPHRLDLGRAVEAEHPAEIVRRVFLEPLRALDPQQRHQQQRHERGAQPVERGAETAVDLPGDGEDAAVHQGGQGQQHARVGNPRARSEQRRGIVQDAQVREQPIPAAIGGIRSNDRGRGSVVDRGRATRSRRRGRRRDGRRRRDRKSGQVWVPPWPRDRQSHLHGFLLVPPQAFQELPHGLRGDAQPSRDLPSRDALPFEAAHALLATAGQPLAARG